ncbi:MAG TPA: hypothetical protein VGG75_37915 [Trebonia sp.]|jgi:hypothetical protein
MSVKVKFIFERETRNTLRYNEEPATDGSPDVIKTLYVQKSALKQIVEGVGSGNPEFLYVTIETG